jgi:hypothetical protein
LFPSWFGSHTDVVPAGDLTTWSKDPFGGEVVDGVIYGRGVSDMKVSVELAPSFDRRGFLVPRADSPLELQGGIAAGVSEEKNSNTSDSLKC